MASYICTFCELPQYRTVIKRNLTGKNLLELASAQMLNKGLALAGICDVDHQKSIVEAVMLLMESAPRDLAIEFDRRGGNIPRAPLRGRLPQQPQPPPGPTPRGRRPCIPPGGLLLPRVHSTTEECLQEPLQDFGHGSSHRMTPRPAEQYDFYARHTGSKQSGAEAPRLRLRERLAKSEEQYVDMREADNPSKLGTGIVFGLRAVQCLHARKAAGREEPVMDTVILGDREERVLNMQDPLRG